MAPLPFLRSSRLQTHCDVAFEVDMHLRRKCRSTGIASIARIVLFSSVSELTLSAGSACLYALRSPEPFRTLMARYDANATTDAHQWIN